MFLFFFNYSINFAESEYKEHKMLIKKDFHPCWRLSLAVKFLGFSSWADRSEGCTTKEVQHSQPSLMLAICQSEITGIRSVIISFLCQAGLSGLCVLMWLFFHTKQSVWALPTPIREVTRWWWRWNETIKNTKNI